MVARARPKPQFFSCVSRAPADRVVVGMLSQLHARDRAHIRNKLPPIIPDQFTTQLNGPAEKKCDFQITSLIGRRFICWRIVATVTKMAEATVTTLNSPVRRRNGTAPRTSPPTPSFCTERKGNIEPRPSQILVWQAHFVAHGEQQRQRQTGRKATQPSGASDRRELARHSLDADRLNYRSRANSEPRRNQQQRMRNRGCGGDHAHAFDRRQAGALLQVRSKSDTS
jgi:hypothetical protein